MLKTALAVAFVATTALAPAAIAQVYLGPPLSEQAESGALTHTRSEGEYNEVLGTDDHGVPPAAQAQALASAAHSVYDQWGYTGWSGLTKPSEAGAHVTGIWSARRGEYVQAIPPGLHPR